MRADDRLMVPLSELARRMGRSDRTLRRWLRKKGIRAEGWSVYVADLRARWPAVAVALGVLEQERYVPPSTAEDEAHRPWLDDDD